MKIPITTKVKCAVLIGQIHREYISVLQVKRKQQIPRLGNNIFLHYYFEININQLFNSFNRDQLDV